jgi:hypothetical protein
MVSTNAAAVETVKMVASNGRNIRLVTRVTIDGYTVTFTERMPKGEAIRQAREVIANA